MAAFDWDEDYTELVKGKPVAAADPVQSGAISAPKPDTGTPLMTRLRKVALPAVALILLLGAVMAEKGDSVRNLATASLLPQALSVPALQPEPAQTMLPDGLQVYEQGEVRRFLLGLGRMSAEDLKLYAETTRIDMTRAPMALVPFYSDALLLLEHEMSQRGL